MTGKRFNAHDQGLQKDKYAQDLWFLESSPVLWLFQSKTMQYNGWQTPKFSAGTARKRVYSRRFFVFVVFVVFGTWGEGNFAGNVFLGAQKACWRGCFRFQFYSRVAEGA